MISKIKSVTTINLQWSRTYSTGEMYGGLLLDRIKNETVEYPHAIIVLFSGYTKDDELVFELINAPLDVGYESV